jgi:hypothetical protein
LKRDQFDLFQIEFSFAILLILSIAVKDWAKPPLDHVDPYHLGIRFVGFIMVNFLLRFICSEVCFAAFGSQIFVDADLLVSLRPEYFWTRLILPRQSAVTLFVLGGAARSDCHWRVARSRTEPVWGWASGVVCLAQTFA